MTRVVIDQTMSLDGFVTGPDDGPAHPLGTHGGEHLFDWYQGGVPLWGDPRFAPVGMNRTIVETMADAYGAFVGGRRTYEIAHGWKGTHPMVKQVFIVTHQAPPSPPAGESSFTFVADVADAIGQACRAAGARLDVAVGTAQIARQALTAGLVDELWLHVVPLLLGGGVRLFEQPERWPVRLEQIEAIEAPGATHLRYRVKPGQAPGR